MDFRKILAVSFVLVLALTSFTTIPVAESDAKNIASSEMYTTKNYVMEEYNGIMYSVDGGVAVVEGFAMGIREPTTVNIPDTITVSDGKEKTMTCKVVGITTGAFAEKSRITKVSIGANVDNIADGAFYGCYRITDFTLHQKIDMKKSSENVAFVSLGADCFNFDAGYDGEPIHHSIHSVNNWLEQMSYGDLQNAFGSTLDNNLSFDANVGQEKGINYLLIIGIVLVVGLIIWCVASNRKH